MRRTLAHRELLLRVGLSTTTSGFARLIFLAVVAVSIMLFSLAPAEAAISSDTTPIYFSIGHTHYKVPRNYLSQMSNYSGGPQEMVTFRVTYPGFEPLTEAAKQCFESRAEYLMPGPGCVILEFWINAGNDHELSDDDHFQNQRDLFHSQTPRPGPSGLEMYESGSPDALIRTYRKKTKEHTLLIDCLVFGEHQENAICENYGSPLSDGNGLSYRLDQSRLSEAETIDNRIRSLIRSFIVEGR